MPLLSRTPYGGVFGSSPTPGADWRVFRPVSRTIIRQPLHWRCRKPTAERRTTAPSMPARRSTPNPSAVSVLRCAEHTHVNRDEAPGHSPSPHRSSNPFRTGTVCFLPVTSLTRLPVSTGAAIFFRSYIQRIPECAPGLFDIDSRHTIQVRPIGGTAAPNPADRRTRALCRYYGRRRIRTSSRAADTTVHPCSRFIGD